MNFISKLLFFGTPAPANAGSRNTKKEQQQGQVYKMPSDATRMIVQQIQ